ncbi:N,N'-diacetylbacillosaminyl-diphospho-undecaprenol alpha-1,3-N-acetylgalactosaminyltransferase [Halomonas chromatireducens]|uniref:N, N'-diacetylbacillosaminyl-diphospho-undecaprenol alpha-1,3-N-acetylgalactosaminyltransferase n=1 Tax=Halomonas chromatireducens TaxID=507626 RepID=A0A0X8HDH8_9GAMM|nr:N,N'-diacetylbacillosaminyl-diphospho-undecaprenol alpha-1,3-N-acetylgalactosaminyltransferase [Halomonas chromatireducens]
MSFLAELDQCGIDYGFLGRECRKNPFKGCLGLIRFCRRFRPDVIHSHLYYGALFSLPQLGVPHVYTHHNIKLKASAWLYRLLDVNTKAYVGICEACETLLSHVTRRQVVRIDNGVALTRIIPKREYRTSSRIKLVCVGTLGEQKNHSLLLNALSRLADLDYSLTVAGEGSKKTELQDLASSLGIEGNVNFIGNCNNVKQLLHDSDVFVMSSAWEGLPIAQIEATLTGLPVLVTDVGGCAEIVDRVGNGLVAKAELDDYTKKLKRIIVDDSLRLSFHKNALENSGHYTVDNAVERHLGLYDRLTHQLVSHA